MALRDSEAPITKIGVDVFTIPTDGPESDGTLEWNSTTMVLVNVEAGGMRGIGYSYADTATATLVRDKFLPLLTGRDAFAINARWFDMVQSIRNLGRPGICSMAIAAVDNALWDLKAKLLGVSLAALLGPVRPSILIYGSGGFTSYDEARLRQQLSDWAQSGMHAVKMKVGREPDLDSLRVRAAREAIGEETDLFIDANGAYTRKQALGLAQEFADWGVSWFEEPVSSDDLAGLTLMRDRAPPEMAIAAGEYGYDTPYFRRMLDAEAVDVLQADATRCAGITGFLQVVGLCEGFGMPLSSHCAPALHLPLCCAAKPALHMEYFYDHVRIESMLFDGTVTPENGRLAPDWSRPGLGIELKARDAQCYAVW